MNIIDGDRSRFARAQLATLGDVFDHLEVVHPSDGVGDVATNQMLLAGHDQLPPLVIDPDDGRQLSAVEVIDFLGDNDIILRDDFAPADQLLHT